MQVRNEVKELRLLFEVLQILDSASDLSDNLETVLEVMAEHTGMMRGVITLLDEAHGEIAIEAAYGMSAEAQSKGRYKLGEGITGKVIESGKPLVIPNVLVEPLFLNRTGSRSRKEAVSFICVPVKMEGRVIGALSADRLFAASEALEEDMRLLSVLASLISKAVKNRQERHRMLEENRRLLDVLRERSRPEMFVGRSPGLRAVLTQLAQVAPTSATVLLLGESGTGKELAANTIHAGSPRAGHPFIKINCAALPEGLIESELFGHEKGAFTGAVGMRKGRFEAADGGTLFLDEIGELAVKGPGVMKCYYKNPEATAEILHGDWLWTGDMAREDKDGFIYLVDRKKDVIISGGENLYPVQIEDFLRRNEKIKDVAVIGLPDQRLGEIAAAIIELKDGADCTETEIQDFCRELPRYKRPRRVIFAKVPRNPTGKIEKPVLRQIYCGGRLVEEQTKA